MEVFCGRLCMITLLILCNSALEPLGVFGLASFCGNDGSFINLCGICVGGSTGFEETNGNDECNVCFGSNDCLHCNGTSADGCDTWSFPHTFDLSIPQTKVKLSLQSQRFIENKDNFICSVKHVDNSSATREAHEDVPVITDITSEILIDLSVLRGESFLVTCFENGSNPTVFNTSFTVVNSRDIKIISVSPLSVTSNVPFNATVNVSLPPGVKSLVCFMQVDGITLAVVDAKSVSPEVVECGTMVAYQSPVVFLGVSGTLDAAIDSSANLMMKEMTVHPSELLIKRSTFSSDLRLIFIQFNENISPTKDCTAAFSPETISLFGKGWHCWIKADHIVIQLGSDPIIHPGSRMSLASMNDIQPSVSSSHGSTAIVDDVTNQVVEPVYNILTPRVTCSGVRRSGLQTSFFARKMLRDFTNESAMDGNSVTILEVQQLGGQNLLYNWSVSFNPLNNKSPLTQRDALMTWLSVRMLDKSVKTLTSNKISLNNSLMLSNVDYTVTVKGTNVLGMSGEEKRIVVRLKDTNTSPVEHRTVGERVCTTGSPLDVTISSSPATFSDVDFRVEISTSCCDGSLNADVLSKVKYAWSVKSYNGSKINIGQYQGKHLNVPAGTFHGGERYKISCELVHKTLNTSFGSASTSIVTLERGIKSAINVSGVGISTRQPLILDASSSIDLDNKRRALQFEWSCRMLNSDNGHSGYGDNQCYLPNQKKTLLHEAFQTAFKKSVLNLPSGSLPVGRYHFSVKVTRISKGHKPSIGVTTIEVSVSGGSPPLVYIPFRNSAGADSSLAHVINPDDGFTLMGVVSGIKAGCHISWTAVDQPGYITINQSLLHYEPFKATKNYKKPQEFSAELSPGLIGDAKYRFRLLARCPSSERLLMETSYADVDLLTDAPPVVQPLLVEPMEGEALVTEFRFSTQAAYDDLLDYPLRYSFGFKILDDGNNPSIPKFFHSSDQKLSATTYLPAVSLSTTKIQSLLRVCDVRLICRTIDGPVILSNAPKQLTSGHVELLSEGFSSFLMAEEYEDAIMLVESSMVTLEILDDNSLYQLASSRVEKAVSDQLNSFEKRLDSSPEDVNAALRFLKAANAALKHGAFSQNTLQRLVAFKDRILGMLNDDSKNLSDYQSSFRKRRQAQTDAEQPRNVLQPEMVRTFLSVSEVAIFNLSDSTKALNEKRKLLQNVSFFMESLCRGLRNSVPLFIGSKVVSFSLQRLNMQIKYKDDLAIPDWRSSKSGGTPVNATAQIRLGEDIQQLLGGAMVCMGAAYYPLDILSEVTHTSSPDSFRHSAVYYVKLIQNTSQKVTVSENYEGFDVKKTTVRIKIPIWSEQVKGGMHLECHVWLHGAWDSHSCNFVKYATLINKPAVECLCSVVGYHAVFAVESPMSTTTTKPPKTPMSSTTTITSTTALPSTATTIAKPTIPFTPRVKTTPSTVTSTRPVPTMEPEVTKPLGLGLTSTLPPGTPIPNTSRNFTFKIKEDFSETVGSHEEAFISQLKHDILKQVEMPANMIASIELAPGSILVTLHLVDTDIRTVDDVLPSLAAVLQDGRLSVNSVDGRHLSVPPQSLKLLQHRNDSSFVPWIIIGCSGFGLFSIGSLILAAIIVKRQMRDMDFMDHSRSPEVTNKTPSYGRFHFEQTLDGSETTLSRYRSSVNNPLVVSTIGGLASVMGTNALLLSDHDQMSVAPHFMLQPPQGDNRNTVTPTCQHRNPTNASNSSGNTSGSSGSGSGSMSSVQRRMRNCSIPRQSTVTEGNVSSVDAEPEEEDSGIVMNGRTISCTSSNSRCQTPEANCQQPSDIRILPGTPTEHQNEESFQGVDRS